MSRSSTGRRGIPAAERRRLRRLRERLLVWFDENHRSYPWRTTRNWFHLLMAEMMLRRTRADQVLPAYLAFTDRFSTASEAAAAPHEVSRILSPLGLQWRNDAVLSTLAYLKDNLAVRRLSPEVNLRSVPGVGDYSEGMIRSILFGERRPAIDVNVVRVLARFLGVPLKGEMRRTPWAMERAAYLADCARTAAVNLALIDFGALICRPSSPLCGGCPLRRSCAYSP